MTRTRKLGLVILIADLLAAIWLTFGGVFVYRGPILVEKHDQGTYWYEFGVYGPKAIRKSVAVPLCAIGIFSLTIVANPSILRRRP